MLKQSYCYANKYNVKVKLLLYIPHLKMQEDHPLDQSVIVPECSPVEGDAECCCLIDGEQS